MDFTILIGMIFYMLIVIFIGIAYAKKNKSSEDYFIGGRKLGPWVTAMSAEASDMSSWLLMGLPGLAYATGFGEAGWTAIGLVLGTYLNWKIIAVRLRKYTEISKNSITLPDFFSNRFRDDKKILMIISAIFILIFFTIYTATGFAACGKLFESVFGFNYITTMIISSIVIVIYTSIGGFMAASTSDLVQGILMSISILIVLIVGIISAGGIDSVIEHAKQFPGYLDLFKTYNPSTGTASSYSIISVISGLAWGLGYFGMPHILVRFMAIRNSSEIKKSRRIAMIWVIISLFIAVCIGYVGSSIYPGELIGSNRERIFIIMTSRLLPPLIAGIVLSGILAATMSTSDSQLLLTSSAISNNLYKGYINKNASDKEIVIVGRLTVILVAIIGIIIAFNPNSSIFGLVSHAWAGFGAVFGPALLFSLFWKRTTRNGVLAGMLSGGIVVIIWINFISRLGGIFEIYELLPGFIISTIFILMVSLLDKVPSREIIDEFESVNTSTF